MKALIFTFILTLFVYPLFAQTTYYVSEDGKDNRSGLTENKAFATITHAASQAQHGDTILVLPGTYANASYGELDVWKDERTVEIVDKNNPSSKDYLVIKPKEKNSVFLRGDGSFVFQIRNSSYIRVEGFKIIGELDSIPLAFARQYQFTYKDANGDIQERVSPGTPDSVIAKMSFPRLDTAGITRPPYFNTAGISVNASHHIDILNNTVSKMPGEGIRSFTSDFLNIIGNTVFNCSRRSSTGVHGLSVYTLNSSIDPDNRDFTGVRVLISQNRVFRNVNELYSWSAKKEFINPHFDEGKGITIQRCVPKEEGGWNAGIIRIENNISYRNGFSGIQINSGSRIEIVNNTCFENNVTSAKTQEGDQHGISVQEGNDILIANNIVQSDSTLSVNTGKALKISSNSGSNGSLVVTDNLILGRLNNKAKKVAENTQNTLPSFMDSESRDFSLQSDSPAKDAGNALYAPTHDFFGKEREGQPDMGAIEFTDVALSGDKHLYAKVNLFPNPTSHSITLSDFAFSPEEVNLYTIAGQEVTHLIRMNQNNLILSALPEGIYILRVKTFVAKVYKQ